MQRIISAFSRGGGILVFVILEAFCFFLIVTFNSGQKEIYSHSKTIISDGIQHRWDNAYEFWYLSETNDSLAGVIANLREELDNAKFNNTIWKDTAAVVIGETEQQYTYTEAKVIRNSINLPNNYITLDKGTNHGIDSKMGVIDDKGIVGIVVNSSSRYTHVMTILHKDSKIAGEVEVDGVNIPGTLVWENTMNHRELNLKYIPKEYKLEIGNKVLTSGYSSFFPQGLVIGEITELGEESSGSNFQKIKVRLSNDLNRVKYAYIIENKFLPEQKELEEAINE